MEETAKDKPSYDDARATQRGSWTYQPPSTWSFCSGEPIPATNNFHDVGCQTSILDLGPGGFWSILFNLQSLLCLSTRAWDVRTSKLNLECRIRTWPPLILNCFKKLRGFKVSTLYPGNTSFWRLWSSTNAGNFQSDLPTRNFHSKIPAAIVHSQVKHLSIWQNWIR